MSNTRYKVIIVPEEAHTLAKQLAKFGLEENMGEACANALREYVKKREEMIKELQAVRAKWIQGT